MKRRYFQQKNIKLEHSFKKYWEIKELLAKKEKKKNPTKKKNKIKIKIKTDIHQNKWGLSDGDLKYGF